MMMLTTRTYYDCCLCLGLILCHVYWHGCDIPELHMVVSFIPNLLLVCRLAHSFR